jgi:hypothetical protein
MLEEVAEVLEEKPASNQRLIEEYTKQIIVGSVV